MVNEKVNPFDLASVSPLVLGGAILNQQYTDEPESIPLEDIIKYAFSHGINAIDTSPYYGPSEVLYGRALSNLRNEFPRDTYFICTKVGRIGAEEFNYSRDFVRFSVHRSCERLHTTYLDLVYLHDVEFVKFPDILEALKELRTLKNKGVIKNFGISGYPIDFITWLAEYCSTEESDIGSLDAVLECASQAAKYCQEQNVDLADLATRYAISEWVGKGPVVLGVSSMEELKLALDNYEIVKSNGNRLSSKDGQLVEYIQKNIFKEHFNEEWSSGIPHPEMI
ncbi:BTE_HP_G0183680.mRNA.1.CDS.1 [Saccharomyces cerevisiae]|nr:BTE_HP_G0183680.mRNA.1.CDS.1 [Saccharomyces cerevisiae]CAI7020657.1 BTE_HP_G0183680.mRNA.1.CDS.1 [Saccharomyces cerevisiae]